MCSRDRAKRKGAPDYQSVLIDLGSFANHHDFVAFRELLAGMPPIRSVVPRCLSQDRFEMGLESVETSQVVARELSKKRFKGVQLRVLRVEAASIEIAIHHQGVSRE